MTGRLFLDTDIPPEAIDFHIKDVGKAEQGSRISIRQRAITQSKILF